MKFLPLLKVKKGCEMANKKGSLLVSPHSDDICMSSAHIINRGLLPEPLHLVTVFSLSFHLAGFTPQPDRSMVPKIRMEEDIRFCRAIGATYHALGFYDSYHWRQGLTFSQGLISRLEHRLLKLIHQLDCLAVVCPFPKGINGSQPHTHHEAAFQAVTQASVKVTKTLLLFVDDQPYSRVSLDEKVGYNNTDYIPHVIDFDWRELNKKMGMMKIYKSQMRDVYFDAVRVPAPGGKSQRYSESLWVPSDMAATYRNDKKLTWV